MRPWRSSSCASRICWKSRTPIPTAFYSNTARAHEQGTTHDWVVIYRDDDGGSGQWTVVTWTTGALAGKRVVRGREAECARRYSGQA